MPPKPEQCTQLTKKGDRCRRAAVTGGLCKQHFDAQVPEPTSEPVEPVEAETGKLSAAMWEKMERFPYLGSKTRIVSLAGPFPGFFEVGKEKTGTDEETGKDTYCTYPKKCGSLPNVQFGVTDAKHTQRRLVANISHGKFGKYQIAKGDEVAIRLSVANSYDKSLAFRVHVGAVRAVCSNGLVVGDNLVPPLRVAHHRSHKSDAFFRADEEFVQRVEDLFKAGKRVAAEWQRWRRERTSAGFHRRFREEMCDAEMVPLHEYIDEEVRKHREANGGTWPTKWEFFNFATYFTTHCLTPRDEDGALLPAEEKRVIEERLSKFFYPKDKEEENPQYKPEEDETEEDSEEEYDEEDGVSSEDEEEEEVDGICKNVSASPREQQEAKLSPRSARRLQRNGGRRSIRLSQPGKERVKYFDESEEEGSSSEEEGSDGEEEGKTDKQLEREEMKREQRRMKDEETEGESEGESGDEEEEEEEDEDDLSDFVVPDDEED
uniref:Uncharacterized protein n=1 Tax=Chromera velia CCMP2878 TaxID=1169474 RepID=A0A0G4H2L8_9ALVE|eukprot:Cvel_24451.t1-p1 / transcript=Cvel_24451.t1 / gene=Cvel_24451 / organism=Chromera_velia_CCMP2878 / gene_product=hypothetical protein / transcript_product=hypothetical protein / location=Cvel_scaffold2644:2552-4124(-) / protein_length=489 / sequence_SO=supercontig / SO=protein_coding / is_pseudo=false